jgi:hypothetical protein
MRGKTKELRIKRNTWKNNKKIEWKWKKPMEMGENVGEKGVYGL